MWEMASLKNRMRFPTLSNHVTTKDMTVWHPTGKDRRICLQHFTNKNSQNGKQNGPPDTVTLQMKK
jgi:hypothetical protein